MALVVISGGVRSGKSSAAQRAAEHRLADGGRVIVAVFGDADGDPEMEARIERHRLDRPPGFETIEPADSRSWMESLPTQCVLVLDCVGTMLGRVMQECWSPSESDGFAEAAELPDGYAERVEAASADVVAALLTLTCDRIVVTNEVGLGVVPAHATGRLFRDVLGRANRILVEHADVASLVVAGRVLDLTDLPREIAWPHD
ncbi:MAG: bifunctional adenosylcobinamide kinase/adenosylcobinamide-phosphate guanylyltransferase [Actinomycetota bacterium]|nr:bifunctional adenosylcobinamide kinase/adenosylcobinamide-phosphate guanylyltransferase [Actinomycetota bacterium]